MNAVIAPPFRVGDYAFAAEMPNTVLTVERLTPDGRVVLRVGKGRKLTARPEQLRRADSPRSVLSTITTKGSAP